MNNGLKIRRNKLIFPIYSIVGICVGIVFSVLQRCPIAVLRRSVAKWKNSNVVSNVIGLTLFNAIGGFLVLVTNVKLANTLGASLFGMYSYYLAVGEVGANFVRYGRHKSMIRDLIQYPDNNSSLISNTLLLGIINTFIFLLVVAVFSSPLDVPLNLTVILLVISPCLISLDFQPVYEAMKLMSWHSVYYLVQKSLFLVGIWGFYVVTYRINLSVVAIVLFLSWILILVVQYREIIIQLKIKLTEYISFRNIWKLYRSNFLIALSCMAGVAFGPYIRLILNNYVSSSAVGIYSAGFQLFLMSQFIIHQISRVGNPMMAEAGRQECSVETRNSFVKRYVKIMILGTLPFFIPLFFFPKAVTSCFFSEEYAELYMYLPYFAIYLMALSIGIVYTQFLISIRKDKVYFLIYISGALLTIVSGYILIPICGVLGGVLSLCLSHSIACIGYYVVAKQMMKK